MKARTLLALATGMACERPHARRAGAVGDRCHSSRRILPALPDGAGGTQRSLQGQI